MREPNLSEPGFGRPLDDDLGAVPGLDRRQEAAAVVEPAEVDLAAPAFGRLAWCAGNQAVLLSVNQGPSVIDALAQDR